jgi:hypothetical protein
MKVFRKMGLAAALAGFMPSPLFACAACYGKSSDPLAHGMNWGIFTLLGIVGMMLVSIATFFFFLIRREAAAQESKPEPENLSGAQI